MLFGGLMGVLVVLDLISHRPKGLQVFGVKVSIWGLGILELGHFESRCGAREGGECDS